MPTFAIAIFKFSSLYPIYTAYAGQLFRWPSSVVVVSILATALHCSFAVIFRSFTTVVVLTIPSVFTTLTIAGSIC